MVASYSRAWWSFAGGIQMIMIMVMKPSIYHVTAFSVLPLSKKTSSSASALFMNKDNDDNAMKNDGGLTSALARLDQAWEIQQRTQSSSLKNQWSKYVLKDKDDENDENVNHDDDDTVPRKEEFVYLLEPSIVAGGIISPSCYIVFTGGAGLGQFPHIAYNEFLSMVSERLNAVVFAVPYQVGLDHFTLAKTTGDQLRRAIIQYQDTKKEDTDNAPRVPMYTLAHSLGAKLQTIYLAATQQQFDGIGYMSFNNFGFASTIGMARSFATELRKDNDLFGGMGVGQEQQEMMVNTILNFAEAAVGAIGVEFTPNPQDMERLIQLKYKQSSSSSSTDNNYCEKTRLFVFDDDSLDNSFDFYNICGDDDDDNNDSGKVSVSWLTGTHLTPVYFKFDLSEITKDVGIPNEMAYQAVGGFQGASFGNRDELGGLVDEVCNWIVGKPPTHEPPSNWGQEQQSQSSSPPMYPKKLSPGTVIETETE
mmetsp:Transcript_13148/g.18608  ORF Transcript_13148/g.18608 Transcript_13148/m.18608 type:complete len:478 (+) Transcript_13148:147-1580(+)